MFARALALVACMSFMLSSTGATAMATEDRTDGRGGCSINNSSYLSGRVLAVRIVVVGCTPISAEVHVEAEVTHNGSYLGSYSTTCYRTSTCTLHVDISSLAAGAAATSTLSMGTPTTTMAATRPLQSRFVFDVGSEALRNDFRPGCFLTLGSSFADHTWVVQDVLGERRTLSKEAISTTYSRLVVAHHSSNGAAVTTTVTGDPTQPSLDFVARLVFEAQLDLPFEPKGNNKADAVVAQAQAHADAQAARYAAGGWTPVGSLGLEGTCSFAQTVMPAGPDLQLHIFVAASGRCRLGCYALDTRLLAQHGLRLQDDLGCP